MKLKRMLKWLALAAAGTLGLALLSAVGLWLWLRASLPQLEGARQMPGLTAPVVVERDALGAPTIRATNRLDASRALGFIHAQDRFFQMDLSRRAAAGELAALLGPVALGRDKLERRHRFRARAERTLAQAPPEEVALLRAYAEGVNTGLRALGARPPEYIALRAAPEPWRPEDSYLVSDTMFLQLQDDTGENDHRQQLLRKALPPVAQEFFAGSGSEWEAALDDSQLPRVRMPGPEEFSYAALARLATTSRPGPMSSPASEPPQLAAEGFGGVGADDRDFVPGSNNWAVDGRVSAVGSAIVCDDMHLGLAVPPVWYRVRLIYQDPELGQQDIIGVTLPGAAFLVVGSNRHIAWGFTNAYVDTTDLVALETDRAQPRRYRTPEGWREFERREEILRVRGRTNEILAVDETIWGPVVHFPDDPAAYALAWIPHEPGTHNTGLLGIERARNVEAALSLAPTVGIPVQNLVVGDRQGSIGYTLMGRLPERVGFDGAVPVSWADGRCGWRGLLPADRYPRVLNPKSGRLWTANNRTLGSPDYLALHPEPGDFGPRARQIRDDLRELAQASETNLWALYHDDRAVFLGRWQELLLNVLDRGASTNADWRKLRTLVAGWGGRAAPESQGYRFVRVFRLRVHESLFQPVNEHLAKFAKGFRAGNEDAAWAILTQRPAHLLNPKFADFDALLADSVDGCLASLREQKLTLAQATWGQRNQLRIQHPLSQAVPALGRWLDLPSHPMPGDRDMPRVQAPAGGPSERLVVTPGREERGLFNLPGGQCGHFLSPFYRAGFEAWVKAEPLPLLPGAAQHTLTLLPGAKS